MVRSELAGWMIGLAASSCTLADLNRLSGEPYALDSIDRSPAPSEPRCHPESLIRYRGTWVKLEPPSDVAPPFAARLERFEELLTQIGQQVYGRAPTKILHVGTYACREVAARTEKLSEHALGNAIDVTGFHFPALPVTSSRGDALPKPLRAAFTVTVFRDYEPPARATEVSALHQHFFGKLRQALRESDLFRGVIGPPDPEHRTHFHLDMAPWTYRRIGAAISGEDPASHGRTAG